MDFELAIMRSGSRRFFTTPHAKGPLLAVAGGLQPAEISSAERAVPGGQPGITTLRCIEQAFESIRRRPSSRMSRPSGALIWTTCLPRFPLVRLFLCVQAMVSGCI